MLLAFVYSFSIQSCWKEHWDFARSTGAIWLLPVLFSTFLLYPPSLTSSSTLFPSPLPNPSTLPIYPTLFPTLLPYPSTLPSSLPLLPTIPLCQFDGDTRRPDDSQTVLNPTCHHL